MLPTITIARLSMGDIILVDDTILTVIMDWHGDAGVEMQCIPGAHLYASMADGMGTNLDVTTLMASPERVPVLARTATEFVPLNLETTVALYSGIPYSRLRALPTSDLPERFVFFTERGGACAVDHGVLRGLDAPSLLRTDEQATGTDLHDALAGRDQDSPVILVLLPSD